MLIGSGMIAEAFFSYANDEKIVIFASGVSDSKEENICAYEREEKLLSQIILEHKEKILVYFSTCSIYDDSINLSTYVLHKKKMEEYVQKKCKQYYIFRLPQVVGITSSPTLVNFFFTSMQNGIEISINKHSTRNLLHVEEMLQIVSYLIENKIFLNEITNIASSNNISVLEIVWKIEKIMKLKMKYSLIDFGKPQNIDISKIKSLGIDWGIFDEVYTDKVLNKYAMSLSKNHEIKKQKSSLGVKENSNVSQEKELLISIITVVYNGEEYLEKTIKSILSQTYSNIEYIIIDGGSTDGTINIIKKYEDQVSQWISEKDEGIYDAMNKGAKLANGDFVNFMNADDIIYSNQAIENIVKQMNDVDSVFFSRASVASETVSWMYPPLEVDNMNNWLKWNLPNHQTMFFPKSFYKKHWYDMRLSIGADDDYKLFALKEKNVEFIDLTYVEFKRGGVSSNHKSTRLFFQRVKESYIKNLKHKRWIRFIIDPFKLILMFLINALFGEEHFSRFVKMIVKLKS